MAAEQDYRWAGEISSFANAWAGLRPSGSYSATRGGVTQRFEVTSRADYESALQANGDLAVGTPITRHPELVAAVQAHWHATGNNGCHFAMYLSENRERFGWESWVMVSRDTTGAIANAIDDLTRQRAAAVDVDVLSFVLPHVDTPDALGEIVEALGKREGWRLASGADPSDDAVALFGLSIGIDLGFWSEVLGFGQGDPLAYTRRAPFTELAIRPKPPRTARQSRRAFMADVPLDEDSATIARWGKETKHARAQRLGDGHEARGKAKWTTVVQRSTESDER